ncbi:MAG: chorismate mutase [Epulopiscium sp.]|nr:chorismate mutase [Candidatus Epulonipiscium sp.]
MSIGAIRGAITIEENTREEILGNTVILLKEIISKNNINIDDIISITFTATNDIDAAYPAVAARNLNITHAALLCFQEMNVMGSLRMCIRVMLQIKTVKSQQEMKHIYLKRASSLRPDLSL